MRLQINCFRVEFTRSGASRFDWGSRVIERQETMLFQKELKF